MSEKEHHPRKDADASTYGVHYVSFPVGLVVCVVVAVIVVRIVIVGRMLI